MSVFSGPIIKNLFLAHFDLFFIIDQGTPSVRHPLRSTHLFYTKGPLLFSPPNPSVPHQKPLSSTPKTPRFNTKSPSVQQTPQFHTENPSVPHRKPLSSTYPSVPNRKPLISIHPLVFGVELRAVWN